MSVFLHPSKTAKKHKLSFSRNLNSYNNSYFRKKMKHTDVVSYPIRCALYPCAAYSNNSTLPPLRNSAKKDGQWSKVVKLHEKMRPIRRYAIKYCLTTKMNFPETH
ncbi:hypothetical protein LOAG_02885 [Loa loa]|uniref:Uncharacterized protein n=1 Tax=Loa loa TaxID=7209 RepID=A0A1S0U5M1_LOALO|nr:hypothetical protein LOAG_02885 [Loa loa]EFO25601.1 hypothetical protein LOAG_02885 [Loa loa]